MGSPKFELYAPNFSGSLSLVPGKVARLDACQLNCATPVASANLMRATAARMRLVAADVGRLQQASSQPRHVYNVVPISFGVRLPQVASIEMDLAGCRATTIKYFSSGLQPLPPPRSQFSSNPGRVEIVQPCHFFSLVSADPKNPNGMRSPSGRLTHLSGRSSSG